MNDGPVSDDGALRESPAVGAAAEPGQADGFAALLERLLGRRIVPDDSFADMGGDTLAHVQLVLALERALGRAPAGWEGWPLGRLIAMAGAGDPVPPRPARPAAAPSPDGRRNMNPPGLSLSALVAEDFHTNGRHLFHQGFLMLLIHRFGNWRMTVRWKPLRAPLSLLYRILDKMAQMLFGMMLNYSVPVGRRVRLEHFGGMILSARAIGDDVVIRQNTTLGIRSAADPNAKPIIGNGVEIGAGAVIVGDITIGDHAVIGANAFVSRDVPPHSIVVGVPGRVIGTVPARG